MTRLKRYWPELLVFGGILGVLTLLCIPDITWMNTDCDGPHYIYAAKYLHPAHKTSAPLFLLLGHLFLYIPYGTDAWRFAMLSVLASTGAAVFIYLCIRHHMLLKWVTATTKCDCTHAKEEHYHEEGSCNKCACTWFHPSIGEIRERAGRGRWYGLVGALVWGSSALAISQSTIVESYALVTMLGVGAYYFSLKKRWVWTAIFLGLSITVHPLAVFPLAVIFIANKEFRRWRYYGMVAMFLIFYIYIPLTNRPPYMWFSPEELETNFLMDNLSTIIMLVGGLAIWDLPKRIFDTVGLLGASLGLASVVLLWWMWRTRKAEGLKGLLKQPLFWLFMLPVVLYVGNLAPQTYVYCLPSIAWGAIIAGTMLPRMKPHWGYAVAAVAIGLLAFNANYFDIGRTLDPELSARKFYNEELPKVKDDEILLTSRGWEWAMVFLYNAEEGKDLTMICEGILPSPLYREMLRKQGIKLTDALDAPPGMTSLVIAKSIVELNENVVTTIPTTPRTYGAEIVSAAENMWALDVYQTVTTGETDMQWKWRPNNPYDIITGAIEVEEWVWIVFSNYTVLTFIMMGTVGAVPVWFAYMVGWRRKKWSWRKLLRREQEVEV